MFVFMYYMYSVLHADNKHNTQLRARVRSNKIDRHSIVRDYGKVYVSTVAVLADKVDYQNIIELA